MDSLHYSITSVLIDDDTTSVSSQVSIKKKSVRFAEDLEISSKQEMIEARLRNKLSRSTQGMKRTSIMRKSSVKRTTAKADVNLSKEDMKQHFRRMKLEGESFRLWRTARYSRALDLLNQLLPLQRDPWNIFNTYLMQTECHMMCNNRSKVRKEKEKILNQMTSLNPPISYVTEMANECALEKLYVRAIFLFYCAAKLHEVQDGKGDFSVFGVEFCVENVTSVVRKMTNANPEYRVIVMDHIIPIVLDMLKGLREIQNASHKLHVEQETWCLFSIGLCYGYCNENEKNAEFNELAIEVMKNEMGENATMFQIYGFCHNNAGEAYGRMNVSETALERFLCALEIYVNVTDWFSDKERKGEMDVTRNNIKVMREKLAAQTLACNAS